MYFAVYNLQLKVGTARGVTGDAGGCLGEDIFQEIIAKHHGCIIVRGGQQIGRLKMQLHL